MKAPKEGECFDRRGIPIYRGDLVQRLHYRGARRKKYWLYHVAIYNAVHDCLEMVPPRYMDPTCNDRGGRFWLFQDMADGSEILDGHGPGKILDYEDRPRRKSTTPPG